MLIIFLLSLIATTIWLFEIYFAFRYLKKDKSVLLCNDKPRISVVIPSFNENHDAIEKSIQSVLDQQMVTVEVIVIDDGSDVPFVLKNKDSRISLIRSEENRGKRYAQQIGFERSRYEWIATVDSDTVLNSDAFIHLYSTVSHFRSDAATGIINVINEQQNLLTRSTSPMYWFSFFQNRSAQAYFGNVLCCSGALSLWKKTVVMEVLDQYVNQTFLGKPYALGDDRHLTSLFLMKDKKVVISSRSMAYTESPPQLHNFIKQQVRWMRSQVSELFFMFKHRKLIKPIGFILNGMLYFRYLYMLIIYISVIYMMFFHCSIMPLLICLASIMVVTAIKSSLAFCYIRKKKLFYMFLYSVLAFFVLNPCVIYALFTPFKSGWLTRNRIV